MIRMGPMIQQQITECTVCNGKGTFVDVANCCNLCKGLGKSVKSKTRSIPLKQGLDTGNKIHMQGKGHHLKSGNRSDLIIIVKVSPHATFKRHKNDLYTVVKLTFYQAVHGYVIALPLLDGRTLRLKSTKATESNAVSCFQNEGIKTLESNEKGNLYVMFQIKLPEVPVVTEGKQFLHSLDPAEVEKERKAVRNKAEDIEGTNADPLHTHSIYYQLCQKEKQDEQNPSQEHHQQQYQHHQHPQQAGCAHQ